MFKGLLIGGVVAVTAVGTVAVLSNLSGDPVTVVSVIDGDTIDARVDGETKRIRLLNVDTPEFGKQGGAVECLAQEATDFLAARLPIGQEISLGYDNEKQDRYGRDLAGVFVGGELINAEIAREGYGVAVVFGSNDRYHPEVAAAEAEAQAANLGIHSLPEECSVARQTDSQAAEVAALLALSVAAMNDDELTLHAEQVRALRTDVRLLRTKTDKPSEFEQAAYDGYSEEKRRIDGLERNLNERLTAVDERHADIKRQAEVERLEAERRAAEEAERQAEAERQRRAEAVVPQAPAPAPAPARQQAPAPAPAPAAPSGGKYTGCRAYGGNYALTSIDEKGRPYAKIDCATKVQIG